MKKRILISGGGIAGLTLMNFLSRSDDYEVSLLEKSPSLRTSGAGILLAINATKVLRQLGLDRAVINQGKIINAVEMTDQQGKLLGSINSRQLLQNTGLPTVAIHRHALHSLLSERLDQAAIRYGTTITQMEKIEQGYLVNFSQGEQQQFDLVVAADGVHSSLRHMLELPHRLRYSGYTCWRFIVEQPALAKLNSGIEMVAAGRRLGIFPIGESRIYCYVTLNASQGESKFKALSVDGMKSLLEPFKGEALKVVEALSDETQLIHGDLCDQQDIILKQPGLAFVGDASHATTPNMGQGAAMGIEDAYILSSALNEMQTIEQALSHYEKQRAPRVKLIRDRSYTIGKMVQWESRLAITLRNGLMRMLPKGGLTKDQQKLLLNF